MHTQPPPLFQSMLFENPWMLIVALVGAGAVCHSIGRNKINRTWSYAGKGLPLTSLLVFGLAQWVVTDHERLLERTKQLVAATESPVDVQLLRSFFEPQVQLSGPDGSIWMEGKALLDKLTGVITQGTVIGDQKILEIGVETEPADNGKSVLRLRTMIHQGPAAGQPQLTRWFIGWRWSSTDHAWRVHQVRWLSYMGHKPSKGLIP